MPPKARPPRKTQAAPTITPFEDLAAPAIQKLLAKLAKATLESDAADLLLKVVGDEYDRPWNEGGRPRSQRLLIHLLGNDLLPATLATVGMVNKLGRQVEPADTVKGWVKLLERLPKTLRKFVPRSVQADPLLPEWDSTMQSLAAWALVLEREELLAAFPRLKGPAKTGVAFLFGLSGIELAAEMKREVLEALLAVEETRFDEWPPVVQGLTVKTVSPPRDELLAMFGTPEEVVALRTAKARAGGDSFATFLLPLRTSPGICSGC